MASVADRNSSDPPVAVEQIAGILDSVDYTIVVLSNDCRVEYINEAGTALIGRSRQSVVGERAALALPEFFGKTFQHQRNSTNFSSPCNYEEYFPPRDLWTEVHICPSPVGLLACARDITSRKRTERILTG